MLTSTQQYTGAIRGDRNERALDLKSRYTLAAFVTFCVTIAFYPMTEPAELTSNELNAARIAELGLLLLAAGVITLAIIHERCDLSIMGRAPLITFLFCLWAMLSGIWSTNPLLSFARGGTLMLLLYIAVALFIYVRHISADSERAISIVTTSGLLASVVILLLSNVVIWDTPMKFTDDSAWSGRPGRFHLAQSVPLDTGELLSLAIIMTAFGIRNLATRIILLCLLFWLLLLTDSRNMLVFVPVALAVAWFQQGSVKLRFIMMSAMTCGLVVLAILAFNGNLSDFLPSDLSTLNGRIPLWEKAGGIVAENPLLGVGYYASRFYLMNSNFFAGHAHNAYVETLMSTGLIGLSLMLVFMAHCVKVGISANSSLLTAIVMLCVLGSFFNPLILTSNPHTFYLIFAYIVFAEETARRRHSVADDSRAHSQSTRLKRLSTQG